MANAAFVVLAGTETHEGLGRVANAIEGAKEFAETDGDEVEVGLDRLAEYDGHPSIRSLDDDAYEIITF